MAQDRIVLHYLKDSRASRIVFLFEELGLEYEIKAYEWTPELVAPPELKLVWPLGLSPAVQIFKADDPEPIVLAESGQIVQFILNNYDSEGKFKPESMRDQVLVDYYLHFAEGTLEPHIVSLLVGYVASQRAPFGFGWLVKLVLSQINSQFYLRKLKTALAFLNSQLEAKDGGYFVGNKLSGADFILDFPINENLFLNPYKVKRLGIDIDPSKDYPRLVEWNKLITERPLHVKALEKKASVMKNKRGLLG
ncbi:hypothetical protein METBIDRAFT_226484 [Metschnikowia bicuspidata var. bicuspidata NRRL YB-4993]|uniref:Glutathione S-transferase n=1 Tax=Metschnikowia bicuspidata var. bicuspidata NRRL YB-4993 TaxID=869754 RepID=A0A1A0H1S6_9ASCO|nr:hypothetical protein METBIDRAFT_226484 [Metschnikowia bicuspidata var. bicuspidata NRRL YB-4993]OBA17984.1 hypothetical protein METBIDRAFT_226484 [Metschnikowia bicuspidata var. bicuspidata NRRL YB-4993]